jgi:hypothetical protein
MTPTITTTSLLAYCANVVREIILLVVKYFAALPSMQTAKVLWKKLKIFKTRDSTLKLGSKNKGKVKNNLIRFSRSSDNDSVLMIGIVLFCLEQCVPQTFFTHSTP